MPVGAISKESATSGHRVWLRSKRNMVQRALDSFPSPHPPHWRTHIYSGVQSKNHPLTSRMLQERRFRFKSAAVASESPGFESQPCGVLAEWLLTQAHCASVSSSVQPESQDPLSRAIVRRKWHVTCQVLRTVLAHDYALIKGHYFNPYY